ncbi:hypothetical protein VB738_14715 [Cyanobium gracile UHCC 0139]|uniref:Uncharacterized protein n=1 Tax=Cyanobium gracile UHCC 0139 TaxID=3110308 RepID=A0ABU5RXM1_9CYAN|nr:hypothetical protein [Cyanobium gracile]MEA5392513.1 hypothetical protein [Cyanobium gracile UHCC 0139]
MNKNHPVYLSLIARLESLMDQYRQHPCERNRYRLVRQEQLIAQWVAASDLPSPIATPMGATGPT